MKHNRDKIFNQHGASLIEMLAVISIITILSAVAVMRLTTSKAAHLERQNVARELKVAFERARFDSVKRRATGNTGSEQANVVVGANSFTMKTDINGNGTIETAESRVNTSWNPIILIRNQNGTVLSADVTVAFNKRGEITSTGPTAFLVCNGDCATPAANNSNLVVVTATGTVNILPGGATIPTFAAPGVTSVNTNANIRSIVTVN